MARCYDCKGDFPRPSMVVYKDESIVCQKCAENRLKKMVDKEREERVPKNLNNLPSSVLEQCQKVIDLGNQKEDRSPGDWKNCKRLHFLPKAKRHINADFCGEEIDPDLGTYHLANAIVDLSYELANRLNHRHSTLLYFFD